MLNINMRLLNLVMLVVLILLTIYMFHLSNFNQNRIEVLESLIDSKEEVINDLEDQNDSISADIVILSDSVQLYRTSIKVYGDSLVKIKNYYETVSDDIYELSDSASVEYFKNYIENYRKRFSINPN